MYRVVMVAGICNSVGGGVFLTCHHSGGGEYGRMSRLVVLECANCSLHVTVELH